MPSMPTKPSPPPIYTITITHPVDHPGFPLVIFDPPIDTDKYEFANAGEMAYHLMADKFPEVLDEIAAQANREKET